MSSKNDEEEQPSLAQKMFPLLKSLNGLDATDTLNSFFGENDDPKKELSSQDFFDRVSGFLKNDNITKSMTDILFQSFDLNSSDSLSRNELAGGLSVICMGNLEARISFAFEQYSGDDKMLSLSELTQYFVSIFSVLKRMHPEAPDFQGDNTVPDLAAKTASACMKSCDLDENNKLSVDEFREYFFPGAHARKKAARMQAVVTSLSKIRPEKLLSSLPPVGGVDCSGFVKWIKSFASLDVGDAAYTELFHALDADKSGKLDRDEIVAAVSALCQGGSPRERVGAMFRYFDKDSNGTLSEDELVTYFSSVFRGLKALDENAFHGRTATSLARLTVTRALSQVDADKSGTLSLDEFTKFFLKDEDAVKDDSGLHQVVNSLKQSGDASKLMQSFQDAKVVDRDLFRKILRAQIGKDNQVTDYSIDELYAICDLNGDGKVGIRELGGGISMICPGSPEWRAEEVLKCYASNDKGLTKNDLVDYFVSFLTVQSQVDAQAQVKGSIEDMAREMTEEAFDQIDDGDGVLTLEEFKKYFLPGDFNEVVMAMAEIDAKDVLKAFEGVKGNINPKQFDEIMHKLMPNVAQSSRREAFHVFDTDANGSLDKSELGGGLTLLCDGDAGARAKVAFQFFDNDNVDGKLNRTELRTYFRSVFRVLQKAKLTEDEIERPDSIAHFTVSDGWEKCEVKGGGITSAEFVNVFLAEEDPDEVLKPTSILMEAVKHINEYSSRLEIPNKKMSRKEWMRFLSESCYVDPDGAQELFDALDLDALNELEPHMFVSALLMLTSLDVKEKSKRGFKTYAAASPKGDDDTIEKEELEMYFRPIFRLLRRMQPGDHAFADGKGADDVALETTNKFFDSIDTDNSGTINFDEFVSYFLGQSNDQILMVALKAVKDVSIEALSDALQNMEEMDERAFVQFAKDSLFIGNADVALELFRAIDADENHMLSSREIIAALSVFCYGDQATKISTCFEFFDEDGSHGMSRSELRTYLLSIFKVMKRTAPNNPSFKNGATPASLASTTVADAFDNFDADSSGQLSLNEFVRFVEIFSGPSAATGGNASTRQVTVALSEVIKAFESMNASDIASKICELTKDDKTLDRAKFGDFILTEVNKDLNYGGIFELFDALDRDGNNSLTASEVGGILLLCGDSDAKSKASAAFRLYDKDGSNSLCPEELFEYLTSTFKLMLRTRPDLASQEDGFDPDLLAQACVKEIFTKFDKNKDNRIDLNEFVSYYLSENESAKKEDEEEKEEDSKSNEDTDNFLVSAKDEVKIRVFDGNRIVTEFNLSKKAKAKEIYEKAGISGSTLTCLSSGKRVIKMLPVAFIGGCSAGVVDVAVI